MLELQHPKPTPAPATLKQSKKHQGQKIDKVSSGAEEDEEEKGEKHLIESFAFTVKCIMFFREDGTTQQTTANRKLYVI